MKSLGQLRKIAVLRANSLGDFLFCLPALEALRLACPRAEIVYLGKPWHKEFLLGRPSPIDRVIPVPVSRGVRQEEGEHENERELSAFFGEMQHERFDIALQLHGGGEFSNPFVRNLGALLTVGFQTPGAEPLDISIPYAPLQNEIVRLLELVQKIGAPIVTLDPKIALVPSDLDEARRLLGAFEPPFIVLHVGAHDPRRRWPPENFAAVGDYLAGAGFRVVISAGAHEVQDARLVVEGMTAPSQDLSGRLSLSGLTGLLSQAALVISNDSGPLHLANALDRPTVGLYWVGNLVNFGSLYRGTHVPLVSWTTRCPVCNRSAIVGNLPGESPERCPHVDSFITDIPVGDVIVSAERLLSMFPQVNRMDVRHGQLASKDH